MTARRFDSERGAILAQVGVAILVLSAFLMFVVDYGVLWVSRNQAQNAADSGALAGAVALALDDAGDHSNTGPAKMAARAFALWNDVWGEDADVDMDGDIRFYSDEPAAFPAECADDSCIRVDVYRNQARNNALPTVFGWLAGLTDQGVRATATAQAAIANASECLKPWAIADKWDENNPMPDADWTPEDDFDPTGPTPDVYTPPSGDGPGTSFQVPGDIGRELILKTGNAGDTINPGWFQALDLSSGIPVEDDDDSDDKGKDKDQSGNPGGAGYEHNISHCVKRIWAVGNDIPKENGNMVGPTKHGVEELIALDPDAEWDGQKVINSCVEPPYSCTNPGYTQSPRIVALPVFDLQKYLETGGPGNGTVHIVNILGFFVDRMDGNDVVGYLAKKSDLKVKGGGSVAPSASFIKAIQLVR
jgi:Flp pilus assembly protein TadG